MVIRGNERGIVKKENECVAAYTDGIPNLRVIYLWGEP